MLYTPLQPLVYSWANMNSAGITKQRTLGAILFIFQCAGNVAGPQVYLEEAPIYRTGLYTDMSCWALLFTLICSMAVYLRYLNRRQRKKRERMGRMVDIQDMSIMTLEEAAAYKRELAAAGEGHDINAHAFDDLSDLQNPEFHCIL
ncbi:hypothetical protein L486_04252 [Kwoniella mangroviensis CBS 10435]|uniref:Allantoate permease n=1 Tax=Kwoniella mangroviensis CBS 10435 TaxID=1331196 RepID=A0A1B9IRR9_9TREE|nr:hypothetical protein L486_04252 [Kwoniella mangroviensis CBS 10435]